jgi:hypothetical protein
MDGINKQAKSPCCNRNGKKLWKMKAAGYNAV